MKRRPTGNRNFTRTARKVHPRNRVTPAMQMRGGIRM